MKKIIFIPLLFIALWANSQSVIGFKLQLPAAAPTIITGSQLTAAMVNDIITCYSLNIDPVNVQAKVGLPKGLSVNIYGFISLSVILYVYADLNNLTNCIIDVGIGNYWTTINPNVLGAIPINTTSFANAVYTIFTRHWFQPGSWTYINCSGNTTTLQTYINTTLTTFLTVNGGDFNTVLSKIQTLYNISNTTTL
jgi:hypothetical protein